MKKIIILFLILSNTSITVCQIKKELRGVKLTNVDSDLLFSDERITSGMNYLASIGINVIFPVIWNGGYTLYPSEVMSRYFGKPIWPSVSGRDPLRTIIIEAHRNGIEVVPWFEYGFAASYSSTGGHILSKFPEWGLRGNDGNLTVKNGFSWMSAVNPNVQEFLISLSKEIITNYDIDGIIYSDRIPAMPVEGGYDSVTVSVYKSEHNNTKPPENFMDNEWMQWRANKLTQFFSRFKDTVKSSDRNLMIISSPNVYPWGYNEYLQDTKTWIETGLCDAFVPQIYRYSLEEYNSELIKSLKYIPQDKKNITFSGMVIYLKNKDGKPYLIEPKFLFDCLKNNRNNNVNGETMFFYEGLRVSNNLIGDTLKAYYYSQKAKLPYRGENLWRPPGVIVDENEKGAKLIGNWTKYNLPGYNSNILWSKDTSLLSINYTFDIPFTAWYSLYTYLLPNSLNTTRASYTVYSENDSSVVTVDQSSAGNSGWYKIKDVYLTEGTKKVLSLDNANAGSGKYVLADAAMLLLNRKLSPGLLITDVENFSAGRLSAGSEFTLYQNYPNPFNSSTLISYNLSKSSLVEIKIYDIIGRLVKSLHSGYQKTGRYSVIWNAEKCSSGIYYYRIKTGSSFEIKKMLLLR